MVEKGKIFATIITCVVTTAICLTCGMIIRKRSADVPAVEIIAVETSAVSTAAAETTENSVTFVTSATNAVETTAEILMVNINTATAEELDKLEGIGEKTAQAIIEYREKTPFTKIEDIMNVKGIGEKKFEAIMEHICV